MRLVIQRSQVRITAQEIFHSNPIGILTQPSPRLPAECVTSVQSVTLSMVQQYAVWYQHATPQGDFQ